MCCIMGTEKENVVHWSKPKSFYRVIQSQWVGPLEAHGECTVQTFTVHSLLLLCHHFPHGVSLLPVVFYLSESYHQNKSYYTILH